MVGLNCLEHHVLNLSERKLGICKITVLESLQRKKIPGFKGLSFIEWRVAK